MKINDANPLGAGAAGGLGGVDGRRGIERTGTPVSGTAKAADAKLVGRTDDGDSFQISGLSQSIRSEEIGSPERQARVEQLHAELKAGKYQPDTLAVSRSIIQDAMQSGTGASGGGSSEGGGTESGGGVA